MEKLKELELISETSGKGNNLYVVVKRDSDNYQGLWFADNDSHLRQQLIEDHCDMTDVEELEYTEKYIDEDFYWEQIGKLI